MPAIRYTLFEVVNNVFCASVAEAAATMMMMMHRAVADDSDATGPEHIGLIPGESLCLLAMIFKRLRRRWRALAGFSQRRRRIDGGMELGGWGGERERERKEGAGGRSGAFEGLASDLEVSLCLMLRRIVRLNGSTPSITT
jgi:hypothetical protein